MHAFSDGDALNQFMALTTNGEDIAAQVVTDKKLGGSTAVKVRHRKGHRVDKQGCMHGCKKDQKGLKQEADGSFMC